MLNPEVKQEEQNQEDLEAVQATVTFQSSATESPLEAEVKGHFWPLLDINHIPGVVFWFMLSGFSIVYTHETRYPPFTNEPHQTGFDF